MQTLGLWGLCLFLAGTASVVAAHIVIWDTTTDGGGNKVRVGNLVILLGSRFHWAMVVAGAVGAAAGIGLGKMMGL